MLADRAEVPLPRQDSEVPYQGLHRAYFSDLADGWSIGFFDVASQICNNVDIMNLEVLQYSSKPFCFLDRKQRAITPCSSRIKTQISSKYFKIYSKSMAFGPYSSQTNQNYRLQIWVGLEKICQKYAQKLFGYGPSVAQRFF